MHNIYSVIANEAKQSQVMDISRDRHVACVSRDDKKMIMQSSVYNYTTNCLK
jgi:hypothetical protein